MYLYSQHYALFVVLPKVRKTIVYCRAIICIYYLAFNMHITSVHQKFHATAGPHDWQITRLQGQIKYTQWTFLEGLVDDTKL